MRKHLKRKLLLCPMFSERGSLKFPSPLTEKQIVNRTTTHLAVLERETMELSFFLLEHEAETDVSGETAL